MQRRTVAAIAVVMTLIGWAAGRAQQPPAAPVFELRVDAPAGETTIECVRGCELAWVQRGVNPAALPQPSFTYSCSGNAPPRCGSGLIGGWLRP
jgi:hypothetical protein